jgi:transposase
LGHCGLRAVRVEDHTAVLRMLIDRYDDLVALRTQAACRMHVALRELIAGGAPRRLRASRATKLLRNIHPQGAAGLERKRLAVELLADLRRLDRDIATAKRRVSEAVTASGTSLLELHGVGPIVAGFILGHVGDPARFATPERFASYNGTAPIEGSSGPRQRHRLNPRGNRKLNHALHLAQSPRSATTPRARLLPAQDHRGEVEEGGAARPETSHQRRRLAPAPGRPRPPLTTRAREDNQGRLSNPA